MAVLELTITATFFKLKFDLLTAQESEINSDRCLHDSRRAGSCRSAKGSSRLPDCCRTRISSGRTSLTWVRIHRYDTKRHGPINIVKVSTVEDIENFPAQLNAATFSDLEVLKHRDIVVKDRWDTNCVTRHVSDLSQTGWICKTSHIDHIG